MERILQKLVDDGLSDKVVVDGDYVKQRAEADRVRLLVSEGVDLLDIANKISSVKGTRILSVDGGDNWVNVSISIDTKVWMLELEQRDIGSCSTEVIEGICLPVLKW